jgi:hypothetical protein
VNSVSAPRFGTATVQGDGRILYEVEAAAFPGEDWFTYDVLDSSGNVSAKANVHISSGLRPGTYVTPLRVGSAAPGNLFLLKVTVSASGAFTAKLSRGGAKDLTLRGAFDSLGQFSTEVFEDFNLGLDRSGAVGAISVFLGSQIRGGGLAREIALRSAPPARIGQYTGIGATPADGLNYGYAWHVGTASADGSVRIAGQALDGVPMATGSQVNIRGVFPLHVPLYRGKGILTASVKLGIAESASLGRQLRPAGLGGTYDAGFDEAMELGSYAYTKPAAGFTILGESAGTPPVTVNVFTIIPGAGPVEDLAALLGNQKISNFTALPKFQFTGVARTGLFKGKYAHPTTGKILPFAGVAIQPLGAAGLVKTPGNGAAQISVGRMLN